MGCSMTSFKASQIKNLKELLQNNISEKFGRENSDQYIYQEFRNRKDKEKTCYYDLKALEQIGFYNIKNNISKTKNHIITSNEGKKKITLDAIASYLENFKDNSSPDNYKVLDYLKATDLIKLKIENDTIISLT